jgi:hypothetical protein
LQAHRLSDHRYFANSLPTGPTGVTSNRSASGFASLPERPPTPVSPNDNSHRRAHRPSATGGKGGLCLSPAPSPLLPLPTASQHEQTAFTNNPG